MTIGDLVKHNPEGSAIEHILKKLSSDIILKDFNLGMVIEKSMQRPSEYPDLETDISAEKNQPYVMINPEVTKNEGNINSNEGCLSIPGYQDDVARYETISIKYLDRHGVSHEEELNGLLAICVQHEIDHLNGKLFIDYLSEAKRQKIRKLIQKQEKYSTNTESAG